MVSVDTDRSLPEPYDDNTPQDHADMLRDHSDLRLNGPLLDHAAMAAADLIEQMADQLQQSRAEAEGQRQAGRIILLAIGVDPDGDNPLMAARQMRAELDAAESARAWQVATGRRADCELCCTPVVRGQAYLPGSGAHVFCPVEAS